MREDYRQYKFSVREYIFLALLYLAGGAAVGWLFFGRITAGVLCLPGFPFYMKKMRQSFTIRRQKLLASEFREALRLLSVTLKAGYSVEQAFPQTARELSMILGEESMMVQELFYIAKQIRYHVPVEELLKDLARRSGEEEIRNFAAVFSAAKRSGGSLPRIVSGSAETIGGRIEVEKEIDAALASKKLEQKIMSVMPCGIIAYMRAASPGFMDVMYSTGIGLAAMAAALAVYIGAVMWSLKIVKIEV